MVQSKRLTGLHPLAYMGVEPTTPPLLVIESRTPTVNDSKNFNIGALWVIRSPNEIWMLVDLTGSVATWIQLYPGAGAGAESFPCDVGTANEAGGVLNVLGDTHVRTSGAGNTVTLDFDNGTNGQILIGGGAESSWEHITSTGATIVITNGPNSINLETAGGQGVDSVPCDIGTATPDAGGILEIFSAPFAMLSTSGAGNRVTLDIVNGTNGQVLIGGGTDATWANITSTGGSVTVTEGANTINLESVGTGTAGSFLAVQEAVKSGVMGTYVGSQWVGYLGEATALTVQFDVSSAFFPGDGAGGVAVYTAPVDGIYMFTMAVSINPSTPGTQNPCLVFLTTSDAYAIMPQRTNKSKTFFDVAQSYGGMTATIICELNALDTVKFGMATEAVSQWYLMGRFDPLFGLTGAFPIEPTATTVSGHLIG